MALVTVLDGTWTRSRSESTATQTQAKSVYFRVIAGLTIMKTTAEPRENFLLQVLSLSQLSVCISSVWKQLHAFPAVDVFSTDCDRVCMFT